MDNLLDALQKGTAFNVREGARKRTPRTTGGKFYNTDCDVITCLA